MADTDAIVDDVIFRMQSPTLWLSKQQLAESGTLLLLHTSNAFILYKQPME
jgi:hypothetical protein